MKSAQSQQVKILGLCLCLWGNHLGQAIAAPVTQSTQLRATNPHQSTFCDAPTDRSATEALLAIENQLKSEASVRFPWRDNFSPSPSTTASDLYRRSQQMDNNTDRIEALNRAIALAPNYVQAYRQRADTHRLEKQFSPALADYDRASQLEPGNAKLLAEQGILYGELKQWEKIISVYDQLISFHPDQAAHYHTIKARAYAELQQWPQAVEAYTHAIRLNPIEQDRPLDGRIVLHEAPPFITQLSGRMVLWDDPSGQALLFINRGYAYERQNQTQQANADYATALTSVQGDLIIEEELYRSRCRLKIWGGDLIGAKSDLKLADMKFQMSQPRTIESFIERLDQVSFRRRIKPFAETPQATVPMQSPDELAQSHIIQPTTTAQASVDAGLSKMLDGFRHELSIAEQLASERFSPVPVDDSLSKSVGDSKAMMSETKQLALGYFDQAIQMNQQFAPAYYHRGILRLQMKDYNKAIGDFDQAIALNPKFSLAYAGRGEALRYQNRWEASLAALAQALTLDPLLVSAQLNQGIIWLEKGDLGKAVVAFDRVLALDPESIEALTEQSKIRQLRQDFAGAVADKRRIKLVQQRWELEVPAPEK
jgi:tetratricopeptide (TPR) repeat protein